MNLTPAQHEFAAAFISAVNAKSVDALRKLVAPEALACYAKETRAQLDALLTMHLQYAIPSDCTVRFSKFNRLGPMSRMFTMPAQATDMMTIEYTSGSVKTKLDKLLRQENGRYYLVMLCPTAKGAARFHESQQRREERIRKAREIYGKLQDPLRSQLLDLLKQHKGHDAVVLCAQSLNVDALTAQYVLELLAGRDPERPFARPAPPSAAPTSGQQ